MAVTQTYTDPSTGGALDLNTDDILPETVWDLLLSCIKALGGTAGPPHTQATRGVFPASGYVMGATGHDKHVEGGTVNVVGQSDRSGYADMSFADAFAAAPVVTITPVTNANITQSGEWSITNVTTTGFRLRLEAATTETITFHWIALGSDV